MAAHETMSHDEAIELLAWLASGSLDADERDAVRSHAASCVICRRELAELEALRVCIAVDAAAAPVPAPDMRRINARIDDHLERTAWPQRSLASLRQLFASPWRVAFALQTLMLLVIAVVWLTPPPSEPAFRTLTDPESLPSGHYLRVVFDPTLADDEIGALLEASGLTLAGGPSDRGVMTLRFDDASGEDERNDAIDKLRADDRILFAQPVEGGD